MILADKIINERKKNGWSQEELAEKLSVSRQSVSKWESAQATPDLQKLLKLAEIFDVSTDYLLKDEIEALDAPLELQESVIDEPPVHKVSLQEANDYLSAVKNSTSKIALGVSLCILTPVVMIILLGLADDGLLAISEDFAVGIGLIPLFILSAAAVFLFIFNGSKLRPYEYMKTERIDTEYGVTGMVREKKKDFEATHRFLISLGIVILIVGSIPIPVAACITEASSVVLGMVGIFLTIASIGVNIIIHAGLPMNSYNILLQEGDFSPAKKKEQKETSPFASAYWGIVTAIYFLVSFLTDAWEMTWLVWPIAGCCFGAIMGIIKGIKDKKAK